MTYAAPQTPPKSCALRHARQLLKKVLGSSRKTCWAAVLLALCLSPSAAAAGIVTTLPPLTGLVLLLDPQADVQCLLPPGADAHDFQLTPKQVQSLKQADMLVRSSYDDGHWSGISLAGRTLDLWPEQGHAWLWPAAVINILPKLAEALQLLAPEREQAITQALSKALSHAYAMNIRWYKALEAYHERGVIMQHNAWQPVLAAYKVPVWAVLETQHHGDDIGPHRLEEALRLLNAHPNALLWGNQRHASRALQWLQEHQSSPQKAQLLNFDPLGDCGSTWLQLMQANLDLLEKASRP